MIRPKFGYNVLFTYGILFCTLGYTTALACADVEYSIQGKIVQKTLSYQQAVLNCEADGKELCSSKTICKDGKTPYSGVIPGDHWVPVADSSNEWLQIGNGHPSCTLHSHLGSKPLWGLKNDASDIKGNLFCCEIRRKENSITIKAVSNRISYREAVVNCIADGKELCTSKEICEDGKTPNSGPLPGDHWIPVKDSFNEWLQIGNSPHRPCLLHSSRTGKPSWGVVNSAHTFKGNLFCCKKKQKKIGIFLKFVARTITYNQAVSACTSDGKRLCNSNEICNIAGTPVSGTVPGDHWVPVKNTFNEWIQIGNSPHKPCILVSQLRSKPNWGVVAVKYNFKGYLFCCKN